MQWTSAPNIGEAPLPQRARGYWKTRFSALHEELEKLLEAERAQLPPWVVVAFGAGIAAWFALDDLRQWAAFLCLTAAIALIGFVQGGGRKGRALGWFARDAWFKGIVAFGKMLGPIIVVKPATPRGLDRVRETLRRHIVARLPESSAGIAIALVTGDQNAVDQDDADAMRRSGLTHLLSVSGLHIAAVVAFAMFLSLKLLALSEWLALRFNLVLVSAGVAAAAGIGYTLLTGAQVPTVRSCVAALLILAGIALGRDAISIRLIAAGALVVLIFCPEALAGPSFQMSFMSVTAIVALHSTGWARKVFMRRDEGVLARLGRALLGIILTGLAVELA